MSKINKIPSSETNNVQWWQSEITEVIHDQLVQILPVTSKKQNQNMSDTTKNEVIEGLKMDDFNNEKRFLMPLHDLIVKEIYEANNNIFLATITVPENFDRPHLAGLNFEKVSLELIKEINRIKWIEKIFSKGLLYESSITCKREITELSEMMIKLVKEKDVKRELHNRQTWSFTINNWSMEWKCKIVYKN